MARRATRQGVRRSQGDGARPPHAVPHCPALQTPPKRLGRPPRATGGAGGGTRAGGGAEVPVTARP
eukprot:658832-Alexandrium_andersonii.AAC.1